MSIRCDVREHGPATLVAPSGVLDGPAYAELRDTLLGLAADAPAAVLVDVGALEITPPDLASLFGSVSMRVAEWPGVPIVLIADAARHAGLLRHLGTTVPVCASLAAAARVVGTPPSRRRARLVVPWELRSCAAARAFVRATAGTWGVSGAIGRAELIVTELVQNVLQHTTSVADVRVELRHGVLTVAVSDDDPRPALRHEPAGGPVQAMGLTLVAGLSSAWGCTPIGRGKVVWGAVRTNS